MCGITGVVDQPGAPADLLASMTGTLTHRGPDDDGIWTDPEAGVGLGHRRLAIIDPTPDGHQPMVSASGRYVLTYNGELYNFRDLRGAAGDYPYRGHSDTEVAVAAFERWGVPEAVQRFNGMFAFAVWDRTERVLWLARDRIGEKPLYYGRAGRAFVFASELKALRRHPDFKGDVDRSSLSTYLRLGYVPAPYSIHTGVRKLPPATLLRMPSGASGLPEPQTYWSARQAAVNGVADRFVGTDDEAVDALESLLSDAVGMRMVSDVPLGAFLSGGIDSSAIVALMQAQSARPVRTFTIGFEPAEYDEAPHAKAVAAHLGTDHTELYVTERDALDVVPRLPEIYDEPFGDSSQVPTTVLSALTRRHVTVSLSGDGGDELFAGYDRYRVTADLWRRLSAIPRPIRKLGGRVADRVGVDRLRPLVRAAMPLVSPSMRGQDPGARLEWWTKLLTATPEDLYLHAMSLWKEPATLTGVAEHPTPLNDPSMCPALPSIDEMASYRDLLVYLPDDLLVKVDRASMAASLEARVPLLDHRVVEFAWRLPVDLKVRDGAGKWILRQVLGRHVPPELTERPKMGFGAPVGHWLRGPLREWAESLLDPGRLEAEGYIDPGPVRALWDEHLSGKADWKYHLWVVCMFQAWLEAAHR